MLARFSSAVLVQPNGLPAVLWVDECADRGFQGTHTPMHSRRNCLFVSSANQLSTRGNNHFPINSRIRADAVFVDHRLTDNGGRRPCRAKNGRNCGRGVGEL